MSKESIQIKNHAEFISLRMSLRAHIKKEKPGMYVSYCPSLNLYSQGATDKKARQNRKRQRQAGDFPNGREIKIPAEISFLARC